MLLPIAATILFGATLGQQKPAPLTLQNVEELLINNELGSEGSYGEVEKLARRKEMVPILATMLKKKYPDVGHSFPSTGFLILSRVDTPQALALLKQYKCPLQISSWNLRHKYKTRLAGALLGDRDLLIQANSEGELLKSVKSGTAVRILKEGIINKKVEGPRGGPSTYDYIQVIGTNTKGYVERPGLGYINCLS
jgi:hypothetical protein